MMNLWKFPAPLVAVSVALSAGFVTECQASTRGEHSWRCNHVHEVETRCPQPTTTTEPTYTYTDGVPPSFVPWPPTGRSPAPSAPATPPSPSTGRVAAPPAR